MFLPFSRILLIILSDPSIISPWSFNFFLPEPSILSYGYFNFFLPDPSIHSPVAFFSFSRILQFCPPGSFNFIFYSSPLTSYVIHFYFILFFLFFLCSYSSLLSPSLSVVHLYSILLFLLLVVLFLFIYILSFSSLDPSIPIRLYSILLVFSCLDPSISIHLYSILLFILLILIFLFIYILSFSSFSRSFVFFSSLSSVSINYYSIPLILLMFLFTHVFYASFRVLCLLLSDNSPFFILEIYKHQYFYFVTWKFSLFLSLPLFLVNFILIFPPGPQTLHFIW